jgi:hypothetical protein
MKVTTEKVNKVKAFEPFKLVIEFNDISEARNLEKEIMSAVGLTIEILPAIRKTIMEELNKQGFH